MEHIETGIYITVFLSWLAHILTKILNYAILHKNNFSFKKYIADPINYLYIIISLITSVVLLFGIDFKNAKNIELWGIVFETSYLIAIAIGFMSASFVREIVKMFNPRKKQNQQLK